MSLRFVAVLSLVALAACVAAASEIGELQSGWHVFAQAGGRRLR
jgi:hypothetical protein